MLLLSMFAHDSHWHDSNTICGNFWLRQVSLKKTIGLASIFPFRFFTNIILSVVDLRVSSSQIIFLSQTNIFSPSKAKDMCMELVVIQETVSIIYIMERTLWWQQRANMEKTGESWWMRDARKTMLSMIIGTMTIFCPIQLSVLFLEEEDLVPFGFWRLYRLVVYRWYFLIAGNYLLMKW